MLQRNVDIIQKYHYQFYYYETHLLNRLGHVQNVNYGHDDFSIGLLSDTTPHVEEQLMISSFSLELTCHIIQFQPLLQYLTVAISIINIFNKHYIVLTHNVIL